MNPEMIKQMQLGIRAFNYIFIWGKLLGEKIITEETEPTEIKKTVEKELVKTGLPTLTDEEFTHLVLTMQVAQSGLIR